MIKINTFLNYMEEFDLNLKTNIVCIGFFDGVHKMHKKILEEVKRQAFENQTKWSIITFSEKVKDFLDGKKTSIQLKEKKYKFIESDFNPDYLFEIQINMETIKVEPKEFCLFLKEKLHVNKIVVGSDFKFAYQGKGNVNYLKEFFGEENIIIFDRVKEISTTLIKNNLVDGIMKNVNNILGHNYNVTLKRQEDTTFKILDINIIIKNGTYSVKINKDIYELDFKNNLTTLNIDQDLVDIEFI
ncbi:bifunctional riboflavin kinase/FMN adenylyltransferase [Spiroplasma diminutum]|uniref:FAD synthase n=1 Tax=Spiroplasma diminutum CUAS-1 TaxID=1276221 RepID=S5LZM0_9MOLU|nr:bifunctional riboflavin kinase/FMN adenylyltransferase [Spiroplasma diminutum]AGR42041.1 bifunctional riboflavin kinase/FMN adenylyltransferase [Spiroplasma diminutum CUAS-1]